MKVKNCIIISFAMVFFTGCFPLRSSHYFDVTSPDGRATLRLTTTIYYEPKVICPSPPDDIYHKVYVEGLVDDEETFRINLNKVFLSRSLVEGRCDIIWSPDSNYFAVSTPFDVIAYDRNGEELHRYVLSSEEKVSTVHWSLEKSFVLYVVVRKEIASPSNINALKITSASELKVMCLRLYDKNQNIIYTNISNEVSFKNSLEGKRMGQEFQEISPKTTYLIYSDSIYAKLYNFKNKTEKIMFDSYGGPTGIWWISNECVLLSFYDRSKYGSIMDKYFIYNVISGHKEDLSEKINSLPFQERYKKGWYQSFSCSNSE